jgi:hypothetical protein
MMDHESSNSLGTGMIDALQHRTASGRAQVFLVLALRDQVYLGSLLRSMISGHFRPLVATGSLCFIERLSGAYAIANVSEIWKF